MAQRTRCDRSTAAASAVRCDAPMCSGSNSRCIGKRATSFTAHVNACTSLSLKMLVSRSTAWSSTLGRRCGKPGSVLGAARRIIASTVNRESPGTLGYPSISTHDAVDHENDVRGRAHALDHTPTFALPHREHAIEITRTDLEIDVGQEPVSDVGVEGVRADDPLAGRAGICAASNRSSTARSARVWRTCCVQAATRFCAPALVASSFSMGLLNAVDRMVSAVSVASAAQKRKRNLTA